MNDFTIRTINEDDTKLLRYLCQQCGTLDVHTHYTYWVLCKFFSKCSYILECKNQPIGYITAIDNGEITFIWQIGILPEYRGQKLSYMLIDEVVKFSKSIGHDTGVSIASDNICSNMTFANYCKHNNIEFVEDGSLSIYDMLDSDFLETEQLFKMKTSSN